MNDAAIPEALEQAHIAVETASDRQAEDIVMLDIRETSDFTDYFVILTAESARQMQTLAEEIEKALKSARGRLHHREGAPATGWMLLDFGDIIVHIFAPEQREFYSIEEVWSRAPEVVRIL